MSNRQDDFEQEYQARLERDAQAERSTMDGIKFHLEQAIALALERWGGSGEYAYDYLQYFIHDARPSSHIYRPNPMTIKVAERDGWFCHYCHSPFYLPGQTLDRSAEAASVDHKTPRSKRGTDDMDNLVLACSDCNSDKGARHTYAEFYAMTADLRAARGQE